MSRREDLAVFLPVALLGMAISHILAFDSRVYDGDALSRTFQAASVLYAQPPRLANVGFIWTPLPTLLQMPLVAFRQLAVNGFAGQVVSVLFAAGSLVVLNRLVWVFLPARRWRYLLLALYQLNPLVLIFAVNGMTESVLIFWILMGTHGLTGIWRTGSANLIRNVTVMGGSAAMAFLTRYEGITFALILGVAFLLLILREPEEDYDRVEGLMLTYAVPWVYAIFLWVYFNWIIMGNPFYFLVGRGSNREQSAAMLAGNPQMAALQNSLPDAIGYVLSLVAYLYPAFLVVMLLLLVQAWRQRDRYALSLFLITVSFPAFQVAMHYFGMSFGWIRFHIYIISLTVLGAAYLLRNDWLARARWKAAAALLLLLSSLMTVESLHTPFIRTHSEPSFYRALTGERVVDSFALDREAATYLAAVLRDDPKARFLVDELRGHALILFTGAFENTVGTWDNRFPVYLANPRGNVDYLVASDVTDGSDLVARSLPADNQLPHYLQLVFQTQGERGANWRIYRVSQPGSG